MLLLRWQNLPASVLEGDLAAAWDALNAACSGLSFLAAYAMYRTAMESRAKS